MAKYFQTILKCGFILICLLCVNNVLNAQNDYYIKQAESYQREVEYYQSQIQRYNREIEYYTNEANKNFRDAQYYFRNNKYNQAVSCLRQAYSNMGKANDYSNMAENARDNVKSYIRRMEAAIQNIK